MNASQRSLNAFRTMEKERDEWKAKAEALAVENMALKRTNAEGQKWDGEQWIGLSIETPATDDAIAEINKKWGAEILEKLKTDDRIDEQAWMAIWTLL